MSFLETQPRCTIVRVDGYQVQISGKTTWVFLCLGFSSGVNGWGEATLFGAERELESLLNRLQESLRVEPAQDIADLIGRFRQANMSGARATFASALEQAWLHGLSQMASVPLYCLFGGAERENVSFYANINRGIADRSPKGFAEQAEKALASSGAQAVKIAPFDGLRWDSTPLRQQAKLIDNGLQRIAAVREKLHAGQKLLVDCHARFNPYLARSIFCDLGALGVFWVEEPCAMASLSGQEQRSLRQSANASDLMLAGAETVSNLAEMELVLAGEGHDVVLPDIRMTGVADGIAMLRLAAAKQIACSLHNPVGPVLDAVSTHVAAALPSFLILERQVGESAKFDEIRGSETNVSSGSVTVDRQQGIGFFPDENALDPLDVRQLETALSFAGMSGAGPDA
ncbi:enolase C-terminal domain-like protein [Roseibium sp. MMSF_3544]|uniref:enolase C-terminal domain-like protein n=1 Tax=unclassified Roseibium TaxID=2629323 RepID=UPI00273FC123|nr:enolase C-terminal domain-like protein [Roseibium sp. MMSF_3544]